jgi:cation transport regulator ChaB
LHPWEFYGYDLKEYLQRRKGLSDYNQNRYQEQIIAAMVPYMDKKDRSKVVGDAFKSAGKRESLKDQYNRIQKRFEGIVDNGSVKRNKNNHRG